MGAWPHAYRNAFAGVPGPKLGRCQPANTPPQILQNFPLQPEQEASRVLLTELCLDTLSDSREVLRPLLVTVQARLAVVAFPNRPRTIDLRKGERLWTPAI